MKNKDVRLTKEELNNCIPDIQNGWSIDTACLWMGAFVNKETCFRVKSIIADDSFAITFQTMGQYRSELIKILTLSQQTEKYIYMWREIGESHWQECEKEWFDRCQNSALIDTKTIEA